MKILCIYLFLLIMSVQSNGQDFKTSQPINDSIDFVLIKKGSELHIIVDFLENDKSEYRWIEAYIKRNDKMYRLHVSGQLGQQIYNGRYWDEVWKWGNNEGWDSETFGLNNPKNKEYFIKLNGEWVSDSITLMLTVFIADKSEDFDSKPTEINFPSSASNTDPLTWKTLTIN